MTYRVTVRLDSLGLSTRMVAGKREESLTPVSLVQVHARTAEDAIAAASRLLEASRPPQQQGDERVPVRGREPLPEDEDEEDEL